MKKWLFILFVLVAAKPVFSQTAVDVQQISAPATGSQLAASSDSVVCATDTGCAVKAASGAFAANSFASGALPNAAVTPLGSTTDDRCTTTDTTACALVGLLKQLSYLLTTPTGPQTGASSNSAVTSYNTLVSGAVTSAMTGTTSTSVVSGTASNYLYISWCVVSNASTTVSTDILLQDGNGGTTLAVLPAPAAAVATTGGGGSIIPFPKPLKVPTSGNALYAANVTTGSSTKISCGGDRSTVSY